MATYNYPHIAPFNAHHAPHPSIIALTQQPIHYANLQRTALEWLHDLLPRMRIGMPSFSDAPDCLSRLNAGETCAKIIRLAQLVRDRNGTTADPTIDNIPDTTVHIIFFMLHIYDHAHFIVPPRVERIQWDYAMYGETTSSHHIFSFVERTRHNYRVADEFATKSGNIRHRIDTNDGIPREMYCGIPYTQQHIRDRVEQLFHEIECCYNTDIAVIQADVDFITENSRYLAAQLVTIASALSEIARWFYPDAYCVFRKGLSFASNLPQPDTLQYPQHIFNNFAYPYTASSMHAFAEAIRIERRPYEERHLSYECTIDFSGSWIDPPRNTSAHTPDLDEDTLDILVDRMRSTDTPGILTPVTSLDDLFYIPALAMYIIPVHRMHTRAKTPFIYVRNAHPATKHTNHATLIAERLCALPNMAYLKPIIMAAETQLGILKACIQHAFLFASHPLFPSFTADPRKNTITKMFRVRSTVPITAPPRIDDDDDDNVSIASDSEDEDDSNKKTIASTVVAAANLTHVVAAATASGVTGAVIAASLAVPVLASLAVTGIAHAIYGPTVLVPPLSPPPRVRREHHPPARRTRHVDADDPPPPPPPQIIPATPYELDELHERKHARPSSRLFDVTHHTLVIPKTKFILASVIEDNNISAHDMHTIVATIYNHIHVYVTTTTVRADTTRSGVPLLHFRPYAPTNAPGLFYSKTDPTNKRVPLFIPAALYRIPRSASCIAAVLTAYTTITTLASDINAILTLVDHMHTVATPVASEHTRYTPLTVLFYSATNTQCAVFHAYMKQCLVLGRKHPPETQALPQSHHPIRDAIRATLAILTCASDYPNIIVIAPPADNQHIILHALGTFTATPHNSLVGKSRAHFLVWAADLTRFIETHFLGGNTPLNAASLLDAHLTFLTASLIAQTPPQNTLLYASPEHFFDTIIKPHTSTHPAYITNTPTPFALVVSTTCLCDRFTAEFFRQAAHTDNIINAAIAAVTRSRINPQDADAARATFADSIAAAAIHNLPA